MASEPFASKVLAVVQFLWAKMRPRHLGDPDPGVRHSVQLNAGRSQAAAWARVTITGRLELELYDFSDQAHESLGNDVAWIWTVAARHRPRVARLLEELTESPIEDDAALLEALARNFPNVHAVRDWLVGKQIPVEANFEPWA